MLKFVCPHPKTSCGFQRDILSALGLCKLSLHVCMLWWAVVPCCGPTLWGTGGWQQRQYSVGTVGAVCWHKRWAQSPPLAEAWSCRMWCRSSIAEPSHWHRWNVQGQHPFLSWPLLLLIFLYHRETKPALGNLTIPYLKQQQQQTQPTNQTNNKKTKVDYRKRKNNK